MYLFLILLSLGAVKASIRTVREPGPVYNCSYCQPEQIHIAFGEKTNDILVTWTTFNDTGESRVQYGALTMDKEARGWNTQFKDGRGQWIHRVLLKDLLFNTKYTYHCGSQYGWSERFTFKTPPQGENWVVRAAIYGDMGTDNAHSLPYLQDEAERDNFDLILHVGDFAYDMYEQQSRVGDQFMRQIQPLAAIVPYMTCPGNHEENHNFSNYKERFSMPGMGSFSSMFYSWDVGPVHFVAINTEAYYFLNYGLGPLVNQYEWLKRDLAEANRPKNRLKRPWIIVYGHRPMYCTNKYDDCWNGFLPNRVGLPFIGMGLEPLLKDFGVDVVIWAHEHSYERTWPLYDHKVYNGTRGAYINPGAPVHVITGSAGCREKTDGFVSNPPAWSAFRSSDYGFTRFRAHNGTHLYFEQVSVDQYGKVVDSFWILQERHGPFKNIESQSRP
ncbi:acid phosphatase type 7 isoform X1 [Hyposmocoma kahamanoa]|uniref:acid phosphatase type 7 isoform X1 n=1 Tax=Hyposmocoma kahamanoa TaxID=1477025 RepID=UPI000E6DA201|nr:acid phosphatase type 7 isoform X1 [Hyposmocoma kahamanoa]